MCDVSENGFVVVKKDAEVFRKAKVGKKRNTVETKEFARFTRGCACVSRQALTRTRDRDRPLGLGGAHARQRSAAGAERRACAKDVGLLKLGAAHAQARGFPMAREPIARVLDSSPGAARTGFTHDRTRRQSSFSITRSNSGRVCCLLLFCPLTIGESRRVERYRGARVAFRSFRLHARERGEGHASIAGRSTVRACANGTNARARVNSVFRSRPQRETLFSFSNIVQRPGSFILLFFCLSLRGERALRRISTDTKESLAWVSFHESRTH